MEQNTPGNLDVILEASSKTYMWNLNLQAYFSEESIEGEGAAEAAYRRLEAVTKVLVDGGFHIVSPDVTYSQSVSYNIGDKIGNGDIIDTIFFNVPYKHIIYQGKDTNGVGFELFSDPKKHPDTTELSQKIQEIYNLVSEDDRKKYFGRIASGINEFLLFNKIDLLIDLKNHIIGLSEKKEKIKYIFSCAISVVVVFVISGIVGLLNTFGALIDTSILDIVVWASLGGFLSTSVSTYKLKIEDIAPDNFYIKTGFIRILVSIISGCIAYLAIKSNFLFGMFSDSFWGTHLVAAAAGFSETIVTNILRKVESNGEK